MTHTNNPKSARLSRWAACIAALFTLALLAFAVWPLSASDVPETVKFLGRFHPILVHLPIGFLLALLLLEAFDLFIRSAVLHHSTYIMAWLAAGAALVAVGAGILLAYPGNYSHELLFWHRWLGVLTAVCAVWILAWKIGRSPRAPHGWSFVYHPLLVLTAAILAGAGHYGGSLTHGSDYLTAFMPPAWRPFFNLPERSAPAPVELPEDPEEAVVFATLIEPILQNSCVGCHGPERQRGGLRLDSHAFILEGGESGADVNLIAKSLRLPLEDDGHMPPKEKPQLSSDEIALLTWWVQTGASAEARIRDLPATGQISRILEERLGVGAEEEMLAMKEWDEIEPLVAEINRELGVKVQRVARSTPAVEMPFLAPDVDFGDAELARLAPLHANLHALNLSRSGVTDAGLAHLREMKNLARLDLSNTAIGDAGLAHLAELRRLEYLNLYGTPVTDEGLRHLASIPTLRRVFLWQTAVTDEGVAFLQESLVDETRVESWRAQIQELEQRLESSKVDIALGNPLPPPAEPVAALEPVNEQCPISGKPVDLAHTATHEGMVIAFCCGDCLAKFERDPDPALEQLKLAEAGP